MGLLWRNRNWRGKGSSFLLLLWYVFLGGLLVRNTWLNDGSITTTKDKDSSSVAVDQIVLFGCDMNHGLGFACDLCRTLSSMSHETGPTLRCISPFLLHHPPSLHSSSVLHINTCNSFEINQLFPSKSSHAQNSTTKVLVLLLGDTPCKQSIVVPTIKNIAFETSTSLQIAIVDNNSILEGDYFRSQRNSSTLILNVDHEEFISHLFQALISEEKPFIELTSMSWFAQQLVSNLAIPWVPCLIPKSQFPKLRHLLFQNISKNHHRAKIPSCSNSDLLKKVASMTMLSEAKGKVTSVNVVPSIPFSTILPFQQKEGMQGWLELQNQQFQMNLKRARTTLKVSFPSEKKFIFFPAQNSPGEEMLIYKGGSLSELQDLCSALLECVAFNTKGELKKLVHPRSLWNSEDIGTGIYVVESHHPCDTALHHCDQHADCIKDHVTPSAYDCTCKSGFVGNGKQCVATLRTGVVKNLLVDGLDNEQAKLSSRSLSFPIDAFHFFSNVKSASNPTNNFLFVQMENNENVNSYIKRLAAICSGLFRCFAFDSKGFLKDDVLPPSKWQRSEDSSDGLFIAKGVNYCERRSEGCVEGASCHLQGEGLYECRCNNPNEEILEKEISSNEHIQYCGQTTKNGEVKDSLTFQQLLDVLDNDNNQNPILESSVAHVAFCVDSHQWEGVKTAISSLRGSSKAAEKIQIHLFIPTLSNTNQKETNSQLAALVVSFACCGIDVVYAADIHGSMSHSHRQQVVLLHVVDMYEMAPLVRVENDQSGNLNSLANFVRFLIPHALVNWEKRSGVSQYIDSVLYLDADVLVRADVFSLLSKESLSSIFSGDHTEDVIAAVPRSTPSYGQFFGERAQAMYEQVERTTLDVSLPTFNAGILLIRPRMWMQLDMTAKILSWMQRHKETPLWDYGTQPLLLIAAYKRWSSLPSPLWNVDGLGYKTRLTSTLVNGYILHWTGPHKPWLVDGLYKSIWNQFHPKSCSGHGTCSHSTEGNLCECNLGFSGKFCEYHHLT
eukprot:m.139179 g.139179  ORF g.139179 m.139179 type:complete len:1008 (+) comp19504_c0_seq1:65-3088(+)